MVRFEGDRDFPRVSPQELWGKLTDARWLIGCIPDLETVKSVDATRAELVIRPAFAFVRGTLDVTLGVLDLAEPTAARVVLLSKGIGSSADVETRLEFLPQGAGTRIHWVAEVTSLGGLLKMVPSGLVRGAAQKVIEDVWQSVETKLSAEQGIA